MTGRLDVSKPLAGIRVVDFSRLLPGAYCTWLLATLGADVVKVEEPSRGDYQRDIGLQAGRRGSAVFQLVNQGKRSLGLDLKRPQARPVLAALLDRADVVVESFRPGVAARLGIDFAALGAARPALVCLSINGFGADSPLSDTAAHDINYLALSGLMHRQIAAGEGIPDLPLVDLIGGGLVPALSALALLVRARTSGIGGIAEAGLADAVPLLPYGVLAAALLGLPEPDKREGEFAGHAPNYTVYALRDGHVAVGAVEDQFWIEFCRRMGLDPAVPRTAATRDAIAARFAAMTRAEADALFAGADACVTVVRSYGEMLASDHARARGYVAPPPEPGAMPRLGSPFVHDGRRRFADGPAPRLGEHTAAVLGELGFSTPEIAALEASGAIARAPADSNGSVP